MDGGGNRQGGSPSASSGGSGGGGGGGGGGNSNDSASRADSEQDSVETLGSQAVSPGQLMEDDRKRSEQLRKLFVGGLASFVSDDVLKDFFSDFGDITDVVVMKDSKTGRSRGFGFVTFREPEMVDAAQAARPHLLGGKQVETKRAMPREDSDKPEAHMTVKKLFVGALKKAVTSEDLRQYFSEFGNVEEAEVMTWKETGESRGFGFVTFDDYDPVDKCILYKPHSIRSSKADVKKALSKEEMSKVKAKQEQQKLSASGGSFGGAAALNFATVGGGQAAGQAAGQVGGQVGGQAGGQAGMFYPGYPAPGFALPGYPQPSAPPMSSPYHMPTALPHVFSPAGLGHVEYFGSYSLPDPRHFAAQQLQQPQFQLPTLLQSANDMEFPSNTPGVHRWSEVYQ